ncbi:(Fe-S)-binding protein [Candidatus Izimaplasma bacterium ZiA1]|uniref:(Fe-S)-binding protein n=1 Tax=Candidatus Izimoplasma sp. ZiA1 TaxID=2024899 RepID=UPI00196B45C6
MMAAVITLGVLGGLLGLGLVFAADFLKVEVDERIEKVLSLLPGYNCGACGYPGCSGFAEGIVEGEVDKLSNCKPGKDEHYDPIIAYLGEKPGPDGKTITVTK